MAPHVPPLETLAAISARHGLDLTADELAEYRELIRGALPAFERLDRLAEPRPRVRHPRTPGDRPSPEENPLGAWYWRCDVRGGDDGVLAGKTFAIKDSVCVAGVPMMNGAAWLEGFVPDVDATVVTRILDAGGRILGKAVCEHLCISDSSHTSDTGPVLNPLDPIRSTGGSSSGSAALVVAGEVDIALGSDQAGSIRMPSSFCGAYGLKPTYGLVPYTGCCSIERTLDHVGPIARDVRDLALALTAIAGPDGLDPRQGEVRVDDYLGGLEDGIDGLRVGVLEEGFGWSGAEPEVEGTVRACAESLRGRGAEVERVSIPMHRDSAAIWLGIGVEGLFVHLLSGNTQGTGAKGWYDTALLDAFRHARRDRGRDFSVTVKQDVLLGAYLQDHYAGHYYARARNLSLLLADAYDEALSRCDVLVMPTTQMRAPVLPDPGASITEQVEHAFGVMGPICGFDVTGHPAVSVPCGPPDELPIGFMAVGRRFDDAALLRFARACELEFGRPIGMESMMSASWR